MVAYKLIGIIIGERICGVVTSLFITSLFITWNNNDCTLELWWFDKGSTLSLLGTDNSACIIQFHVEKVLPYFLICLPL